MDVASQHRTKAFKEFVKENSRRLQIMYLSTGCHELSAIEECRRQLKTQSFMYEYHEHVSGRTRAAMKYLRVAVFSQNIEQYLFRKLIAKTFWSHSTSMHQRLLSVPLHSTIILSCLFHMMISRPPSETPPIFFTLNPHLSSISAQASSNSNPDVVPNHTSLRSLLFCGTRNCL